MIAEYHKLTAKKKKKKKKEKKRKRKKEQKFDTELITKSEKFGLLRLNENHFLMGSSFTFDWHLPPF